MTRLALVVLSLALFCVATCVGCSGPEGNQDSSLVTESE